MNNCKKLLLPIFISMMANILSANPDVSFRDSKVYLKHELQGLDVKFLLSEPVQGINLPDEFFSSEKLVDFIEQKYAFTNEKMKVEFLRMLRMSFESEFKFQEFMDELKIFIDSFKQQQKANADGCSTTQTSSSVTLMIAACMLAWWRRRSTVC